MAVLPANRAVNVTVTREDKFPTIQGFGTPLLVTTETTGPVNATVRTKAYASMDEVAADWASTTEAYKMAQTAFSQAVTPTQIKIGYRTTPSSGVPTITTELDAINLYDADWYQICHSKVIRGVAADEDAFINWVESKKKLGFLGTTDVLVKSLSDTTNVCARNKGQFDRTGVFFNAVTTQYEEVGAAAYTATRNFDQAGTAYTLKFKNLLGITPLNEGSGVVQIMTGFTPNQGLSITNGHLCNVFVNMAGLLMITEGNTLSGAFYDEIHAADWILARTQEEVLGILSTNARIAMTDDGVEVLCGGPRAVMDRAYAAGLLASDYAADGVTRLPPYAITPTRVRNISASQRRNRIAPLIAGTFRYAGAVHYVNVAYTMTF